MASNGTALKYITTCTLCNQRFSNSALPLIGETPDAQTVRFVTGLAKHLKTVHPQEIERLRAETAILSNQFVGWLTLQKFETTDPNLQASQQRLRMWLHGLTRKNQLTDAEITDKIVSLGLDAEHAGPVNDLCKELRDFLTEQGRYAPQI